MGKRGRVTHDAVPNMVFLGTLQSRLARIHLTFERPLSARRRSRRGFPLHPFARASANMGAHSRHSCSCIWLDHICFHVVWIPCVVISLPNLQIAHTFCQRNTNLDVECSKASDSMLYKDMATTIHTQACITGSAPCRSIRLAADARQTPCR